MRLIETACRVTGVSNIKHLRASHIKPWAESNNEEKLEKDLRTYKSSGLGALKELEFFLKQIIR